MKLKKHDNVLVTTGKDKGKSGLIERVFPEEGKAVIKGIAIAKKHIKPSTKNPQGGIIEVNQKINMSNLALICPSCGKPTRVGYQVVEKGKTRICRKCSQSLENGTK